VAAAIARIAASVIVVALRMPSRAMRLAHLGGLFPDALLEFHGIR
jgi:hypothetical protein